MGVVLFHAIEQGRNVVPNNLFEYPVRLVQFASSFGYIGVFLFFVISGFCIHLQWARAKAAGVEPNIRFGAFWKRRLRRLYPPYVIALLLYGVEVMFGMIRLRGWSRDLRLATVLIIGASALSSYLPAIPKDTLLHNASWFLIHPLWGLGFFILVNRIVLAEESWLRQARLPSMISLFSTLGIFSYSIYLTHELVIMQSWRWINPGWPQLGNVLLVVIPGTILFAWVFFWFCEKPFMARRTVHETAQRSHPQITQEALNESV